MSTELKLRGGTTTEHSTFTGAAKEVTVDTFKSTVVVHDGITPGGHPMSKESHVHTGYALSSDQAEYAAAVDAALSAQTAELGGLLSTHESAPDPHQVYALESSVSASLLLKQDALASGTNIKTLNGVPLLGSGDYSISNFNCILNGAFQINQRSLSGTVTLAAGGRGHDMWKAGASGCTYTFATVGGLTTITISAGSLQQVIEGSNLPYGTNTCVLSWYGTAQGKIAAGAYGDSGVTSSVTGGSNLTVEFGTGTLTKVQLELGSVASAFLRRAYQTELTLCRWYYWEETPNSVFASGEMNGTTTAICCYKYPFGGMRATPTLAAIGAIAGNVSGIAGGGSPSVSAANFIPGPNSCRIDFTTSASTNGYAVVMSASNGVWKITASSEI